jgi:hypothetical protein
VELKGFSIVLLVFSSLAAGQQSDQPLASKPIQRFICNTGYKVPECLEQLSMLRSALVPYPTEKLGPWTWVLVKSDDWKSIVRRMGGNTDSPAFSVLANRETFLEEALFKPAGSRQAELLRVWSIPLGKFLEVAITHELGHGTCNELDEGRADTFGRLLRENKNPECPAKK